MAVGSRSEEHKVCKSIIKGGPSIAIGYGYHRKTSKMSCIVERDLRLLCGPMNGQECGPSSRAKAIFFPLVV